MSNVKQVILAFIQVYGFASKINSAVCLYKILHTIGQSFKDKNHKNHNFFSDGDT